VIIKRRRNKRPSRAKVGNIPLGQCFRYPDRESIYIRVVGGFVSMGSGESWVGKRYLDSYVEAGGQQ
jgi:hypothetical protein